MRAAVCVPWRPGDPTREDAWARVRGNGFPYPMFTGDSDTLRPFNRAAARNAAARAAGDVDVYVFNDADHAMSHAQVRYAAQYALASGRAVHPYSAIVVEDLSTGAQWPSRWDRSYTSGNIVVSRTLYEAVGGWDERFDRWGHEDVAFSKMCVWFGGPLAYVGGPVLAYDHHRLWNEREENVMPPPLMTRYDRLRDIAEAYEMAQEVRSSRGA